jgi:hypothetical protein
MILRIPGFFSWTSSWPSSLLEALGVTALRPLFGRDITAGWTAPLDFDLLSSPDGEGMEFAAPDFSLEGMTLTLQLQDRSGNVIDTDGDVTIIDATSWRVRFKPDGADIPSPPSNKPHMDFRMRMKVSDPAGDEAFFPSGKWDRLRIWRQV